MNLQSVLDLISKPSVDAASYALEDPRLILLQKTQWPAGYDKDFKAWLFPKLIQCSNEWQFDNGTDPVQLLVNIALIADPYAKTPKGNYDRNNKTYVITLKMIEDAMPQILDALFGGKNQAALQAKALWEENQLDVYRTELKKHLYDLVEEMQRVCNFIESEKFYTEFIRIAKDDKHKAEAELLARYPGINPDIALNVFYNTSPEACELVFRINKSFEIIRSTKIADENLSRRLTNIRNLLTPLIFRNNELAYKEVKACLGYAPEKNGDLDCIKPLGFSRLQRKSIIQYNSSCDRFNHGNFHGPNTQSMTRFQ